MRLRLALAVTTLLALLALAGLGVASLVSDSSSSDSSVPTRTLTGNADPIVSSGETLTLTSDQFVTLVQICAAVQNDRLPFLPGVPTATPPLATQATLDQLLANCGQR